MLLKGAHTVLMFTTLMGLSIGVHAKQARRHTPTAKQTRISLGFQTGKELQTYSFQKRKTFSSTNSIQLRKGLGKHFNLEAGVKYSSVPSASTGSCKTIVRNNQVSIPVTAQYTFLKEKNKVRPYCGVGFQYNIYPAANTSAPAKNDAEQQNATEGNKRVSILFTQGVTFEVNTKIQINQSFHFIPDQNMKTIGIDLGVGYKFR